MPPALHTAPALAPGARVALVAPAGPLRDERDVARAVENARLFGWEPVVGEHALERERYLAGSDARRLADLQRALDDPAIDGVWCLRGGYGVMRLLNALDLTTLRAHPRPVIGFSDITALHAAIGRAGLESFHGPTARGPLSEFSRESLERAVMRRGDSCGSWPAARTLVGGRVEGRLVGGNLALLASLAGTDFAPDYEGAILVLEDVNEPAYRIDRLLTQLELSGALAQCAALVFGAFTDAPDEEDLASQIDPLLDELSGRLGVPCVSGVPVGHIDDQWTLPLGALAELDADAKRLTVER